MTWPDSKTLPFVSECKPYVGDIAWPDGNDKEWESDLVVWTGHEWLRLDSNPKFRIQIPDHAKNWYGSEGL